MMEWESWSAFWSMGGNGLFVWGSYAVTAAFIIMELVLVFRRRRDTVNRLLRLRRVATGGSRRDTAGRSEEMVE